MSINAAIPTFLKKLLPENTRQYSFLLFFLTTSFAFSQANPFTANELLQKFPNSYAVVLEDRTELTFYMKKDKLLIRHKNETSRFHLDDRTIVFNSESIPHSEGFLELEDITASTMLQENNRKRVLKVTNFEDKEYIRNDIFYDGVKYRKFLYPGIQKGATTNLKYTYKVPDPNFIPPHFFQSRIPTLKSVFKVTVPSFVVVNFKLFGDTAHIKHTKVSTAKETVYTWEMENVQEMKSYDDAPGDRYFEPHIFAYVEKYKVGNQWKELLRTEKDLYKLFQSFTVDLNKSDASKELKSVVDSIRSKSDSKFTTMKNIYYWVQDNIKYIAFEDGLGGQTPRQANDVFHKRYGDCKDLASLITFMLKQADIPAYLCWIGTHELPYKFSELPLPNVCNHMIAAVQHKGKWIFMDGTSTHSQFGKPSQFIQGKEGMIGISADSFVVVKVPVVPSIENKVRDTTFLSIESTKIRGNSTMQIYGFNKSYLLDNLYYRESSNREDDLKNYLRMGNKKCQITNMVHTNMMNKDLPLSVRYDFLLDDMVKSIDSELYVSLIMEQVYEDLKIDTTGRKLDKFEKYTYDENAITILKLPTGYAVKKLPQNMTISFPNFSFSCSYVLKKNTVEFTKKFVIGDLKVPVKDFQSWNQTVDKLLAAKKDHIVLKQIQK